MSITWNPLDKDDDIILSNGNKTITFNAIYWGGIRAIKGESSGKWYWENTVDSDNGFYHTSIGAGLISSTLGDYVGAVGSYGYRGNNGNKYASGVSLGYGSAYGAGDIIGVALDMDLGKIWWSKNGVWQASGNPAAGTGAAYSGLSGTMYPMCALNNLNDAVTTNFGASPFAYTVPAGFSEMIYFGCDAKITIVVTETTNLDGKVEPIIPEIINILDGKVEPLKSETTNLDGKVYPDFFETNLLNGKTLIKDTIDVLLDGKIDTTSKKYVYLDGILEISFTPEDFGESLYWDNGAPILVTPDPSILNLTYWKDAEAFGDLVYRKIFENLNLQIVNGKIHLKDSEVNILDAEIIIKDPIEIDNLLDGTIETKTIPVGLVKILIS